ncbi:MAG TPA: hypothetical protein VM691_00115 [Myxococcales bacterium]|nr:hypothetical protein [Myxococcales bacterium]
MRVAKGSLAGKKRTSLVVCDAEVTKRKSRERDRSTYRLKAWSFSS